MVGEEGWHSQELNLGLSETWWVCYLYQLYNRQGQYVTALLLLWLFLYLLINEANIKKYWIPRLVWLLVLTFSLPDWSGKLNICYSSQTGLGSWIFVTLPRPVWEAEYFYSSQTGLGSWIFVTLPRPVWIGIKTFILPDRSGKRIPTHNNALQ